MHRDAAHCCREFVEFAHGRSRDVAVRVTDPNKELADPERGGGLPERGWEDIGNGDPVTWGAPPAGDVEGWAELRRGAASHARGGELLPESTRRHGIHPRARHGHGGLAGAARRHGIRPRARHVTRTATCWCAAAVGSLHFNSEHDRNLPETNRIPDKDRLAAFPSSIRLLKRPHPAAKCSKVGFHPVRHPRQRLTGNLRRHGTKSSAATPAHRATMPYARRPRAPTFLGNG